MAMRNDLMPHIICLQWKLINMLKQENRLILWQLNLLDVLRDRICVEFISSGFDMSVHIQGALKKKDK